MMENKDLIKVELAGIPVSSTISGGGYALLLKEIDGDRRIPIIIGHFEAQAIAFEIEGLKPPRPLTHELMKNIIEILSYKVDSIIISELRDSTFFAKIVFDTDEIDPVDARPSDAIAIALKFGASIYVSRDVMDEIGFVPKIDFKTDNINLNELSDLELNDFENESEVTDNNIDKFTSDNKDVKLKKLQNDLENAVNNEDYEKAAELRDQIKKLEISNLN